VSIQYLGIRAKNMKISLEGKVICPLGHLSSTIKTHTGFPQTVFSPHLVTPACCLFMVILVICALILSCCVGLHISFRGPFEKKNLN
jgi:hypothetical protein